MKFEYFTEEELGTVSEKEAEVLAKKACEDYMTKCNLKNIDDARQASKKMLAVANDLVTTMLDGNVEVNIIQ